MSTNDAFDMFPREESVEEILDRCDVGSVSINPGGIYEKKGVFVIEDPEGELGCSPLEGVSARYDPNR
jgi:hypothetical protein